MQLMYKVANAPVAEFPFPHILVRDVFPADYYRELREHLPPLEVFKSLQSLGRVSGSYPDARGVLPLEAEHLDRLAEPYRGFWSALAQWLIGGAFGHVVLQKFAPQLSQRFADVNSVSFYGEALVVLDRTTYALGPHTDTPSKVMSFLFYLPQDDAMAHLGTSIYVPKEAGFESDGSESYHPYDKFHRFATMPYVPNTLFAFVKTPNAFHGVEPIAEAGVERALLLFDIRHRAAAPAMPATGSPSARFSF